MRHVVANQSACLRRIDSAISKCFREADFFLDKTGIVKLMGKDLQGYVLFSFSIFMKVCVFAIISHDIKKRKRDPESRTERLQ